jgi:hypothetical protein
MRARLRGVGNVYKYARECIEDETGANPDAAADNAPALVEGKQKAVCVGERSHDLMENSLPPLCKL